MMTAKKLLAILKWLDPDTPINICVNGNIYTDIQVNAEEEYIYLEGYTTPEEAAQPTTREYYEVMTADGSICDRFETQEEAEDYAMDVYCDDLDLDLHIDVRYVKEIYDGTDWHMVDDEITYYLDRREAYSETEA